MRFPALVLGAAALSLSVWLPACDRAAQDGRGQEGKTHAGRDRGMDAAFREDLAALGRSRILFAHQSVGQNILDGLASLLQEEEREEVKEKAQGKDARRLRIVRWNGTPPDSGAVLVHAYVGENGKPGSKCGALESILARTPPPGYDVALLKFCFIDFGKDTDVDALFETYRKTLAGLKEKYPGTVFVHATVPLTAVSAKDRLTAPLKLLLGRPHPEAGNIRRNLYNRKLPAAFPGEPILDIAGLESMNPDGSRAAFKAGGETYFNLAAAYTSDGGHLNAAGSRRLAREFVRVLADASRRAQARKPAPGAEKE